MNIVRDQGHLRGVELGPYPLEAIPCGRQFKPQARLTEASVALPASDSDLGQAAVKYQQIFAHCATQVTATRGDGSDDLNIRTREVKGAGYYLDAAGVGICGLFRDC